MNDLEFWNTTDLMKWVEDNLSVQYHQCIEIIKEHEIDGKLLKECLCDKDAKMSLLQVLFPNSSDAFLRLSFMRKIEKFDENYNNNKNKEDIITKQSIQSTNNNNSNICAHCGIKISSLLIANHEKHCSKQLKNENDNNNNEIKEENEMIQHAEIEEYICVLCEFCEIEYNISLIDDHRIYCGSRTQKCNKCNIRDTLYNFKNENHKCDNNITFNNTQLDINNNNNALLISSFERHLYDLEKILHDRFIIDYNNTSSHFERFDKFGNDKQKLYKQKSNENVSKIRTYNMSINDISNESRHKFEKINIYKGKTKDELRKEYGEKFKIILNLLRKILENIINEPLNNKYRILKCNNKKLKSLIFSYSSCCEFLKICNFIYITNNMCYKLINANNAKLKIGIGVIKYVFESFEQKEIKQNYEQNKWELNQAYIKNNNSIFNGSWSCKKCNHLNRKTSFCKKCKNKKKHSLIKEKKQKMKKEMKLLSVERWICGMCGNRNAIELNICDNCKKEKIVAAKQYQQYHKTQQQNNNNNNNNNNSKDDELYLDHDEWM